MIKIEYTEVWGFRGSYRGMRNPYDSWSKSTPDADEALCCRLAKAGTEHRKYLRMIHVQMDVVAPMYWWKEMDTYKVGTTANSCSTMHKLTSRPIVLEDFSFDYIGDNEKNMVEDVEELRQSYVDTGDKMYWRRLIQLLPMAYNQRRTIDVDYEVLLRIYFQRRDHKLSEWHEFCDWIKCLPHMETFISAVEWKAKGEKEEI